jgi:serine/threonine protein phosphatase PrpC
MNENDTLVLRQTPPPAECDRRPLAVKAHGQTHVGRVRTSNEDQFLVAELARTLSVKATSVSQSATRVSSCRGHIFLVADGMGGHRAGETASAVTVLSLEAFFLNTLKRFFCRAPEEEQSVLTEFQGALRQADARIFEEAMNHPEMLGMGTTLTLAFAVNRKLFVAHAGDSRCYLLSEGRLQQLTHDHTLVAELVSRGVMSPQQAARSKYRNVVTNALGGNEKGVRAELHLVDLSVGDSILLCSDGLCGAVSDERIAEILARPEDPETACAQLIAEANDCGGHDNITAIVARFDLGDAHSAEGNGSEHS